jgi:hypothetical protein
LAPRDVRRSRGGAKVNRFSRACEKRTKQDVDGRIKSGHDEAVQFNLICPSRPPLP